MTHMIQQFSFATSLSYHHSQTIHLSSQFPYQSIFTFLVWGILSLLNRTWNTLFLGKKKEEAKRSYMAMLVKMPVKYFMVIVFSSSVFFVIFCFW